MHTLEQLRSGQLKGVKRVQIAEQLTSFPMEILELADSLEILDLSNNRLTDIPEQIAELPKLKILFASNNLFTKLPASLGACENLEMVGFKTNQIKEVPEASLPQQLRWLILTDNQIEVLPDSLGERPRLQKLALAGNQIGELPNTMSKLVNLELIRLSANQLKAFPSVLLELPKLAWLAFAGNPFCKHAVSSEGVPKVPSTSYTLNQVLGQGASGVISHADWRNTEFDFPEEVAVKVFKGEVTSDGYPHDELEACLQTGFHQNLVKSIAQVDEPNHLSLVMELIPADYFNLGLPPSLESCTRDRFDDGFLLSVEKIDKIVTQMIDVFEHLHENKVCHGDLYAHNVLINSNSDMIFGDFGAASIYGYLHPQQQQQVKAIESRALAHFIDDLLSVCSPEDRSSAIYKKLESFIV